MDRDNYIEGIRSAWLGEQFGEIFFNKLAAHTNDDDLKLKWQRLAQLEHVTGNKMADLLATHDEPATTNEVIDVDDTVLAPYRDGTHQASMQHMKEVLEKAIVRFDQLLAVAPEEDIPAVQFLVQHELALLDFVECELSEAPDRSLQEVNRLLDSA